MVSTAEICDNFPERVTILPLSFHHFGAIKYCSGKIRTVEIETDNSQVISLLEQPVTDSVLFISSKLPHRDFAVVGDRLASIAIESGWSGIVLDGGVRDVETLGQMPICIAATSIWPMRGARSGGGQQDVRLKIGGETVAPGMHAYVDSDGILISAESLV